MRSIRGRDLRASDPMKAEQNARADGSGNIIVQAVGNGKVNLQR